MITFDSPMAAFTTLWGWQIYGVVWNVLVGTGIVFIPFIALVLGTMIDVRSRGLTTTSPDAALTVIETRGIVMLLVLMIAAQPTNLTGLSSTRMQIQPYSKATDAGVTMPITSSVVTPLNSNDNTFDEAFSCPNDPTCGSSMVPVPPFWATVTAFSEGLNRAVVAELPERGGFRDIRAAAQRMNIADQGLRAETALFYQDCFISARSLAQQRRPFFVNVNNQWMGSEFFLSNNDYYPSYRASAQIVGFGYDPDRDVEWLTPPANGLGRPTCDQWWEATTTGLRDRLYFEANRTGLARPDPSLIGDIADTIFVHLPGIANRTIAENFAIQTMLKNDPIEGYGSGLAFNRSAGRGPFRDIGRATNLAFGRQDLQANVDVMLLGAPVIQSLLRFCIIVLMAFFITASRFSIESLITGALVLFTISSWSMFWQMANWIDESMARAMFPGTNRLLAFIGDFNPLGSTDFNPNSFAETSKMTIVNLSTASLYLLFPILFSTIMGIAGFSGIQALGNFGNRGLNNALGGAAAGAQQGTAGAVAVAAAPANLAKDAVAAKLTGGASLAGKAAGAALKKT